VQHSANLRPPVRPLSDRQQEGEIPEDGGPVRNAPSWRSRATPSRPQARRLTSTPPHIHTAPRYPTTRSGTDTKAPVTTTSSDDQQQLPADETATVTASARKRRGPYPTTPAEHPDHAKDQPHRDSCTAQHAAKDGGRPPGRGAGLCWRGGAGWLVCASRPSAAGLGGCQVALSRVLSRGRGRQ
jgi:hypothetical protein